MAEYSAKAPASSSDTIKEALDANELRALLHYDPETGIFRWRDWRGPARPGDVAGSAQHSAVLVYVRRRNYKAHRLAWLYMTGEWPARLVDHKDGNPHNNAWANLRAASSSQNNANSRRRVTNLSGFKGVSYTPSGKRHKRWLVRVKKDGVVHRIGYFLTPEEGHAAYVAAATRLFGDFARAA